MSDESSEKNTTANPSTPPPPPSDLQAAPPQSEDQFEYDVFISYSSKDKQWVRGELLRALEERGLRVIIDFRDFRPGAPSIKEIERAVLISRKTLLILTPDYLQSQWTDFENLLLQTLEPSNQSLRLIPLLKAKCDLPLRFRYMTQVNFSEPDDWQVEWVKLFNSFNRPVSTDVLRALVEANRDIPTHLTYIPERIIDAQVPIERFRQIMQSEHKRILIIEGDSKLGKTHLVSKVFPKIAWEEYHTHCAVIDMRDPTRGAVDYLHDAYAQLANKINLSSYERTQKEWNRRYRSSDSGPMVRNLTSGVVSDIRKSGNGIVLMMFDAIEQATDTARNWLMNTLLVELIAQSHARIVVAGKSIPQPHSSYASMCLKCELFPVKDNEEYITYCREIGASLPERSIQDFAFACDYRPGMFVELVYKFAGR